MMQEIYALKEAFPQCFDKNGKLMPLKLQEAILDLANAQDSLDSQRDKDSQDSSDSQRDKDSLDSKDSRTTDSLDSQDSQDNGAFSLSKESYSLNWLGKSYAKLLRHLPPNTLIAQDFAHNAQPHNAKSQNVLIKGDNLEALKHLKNAYYRKIKCIYIDPPYNTGGDGFIYNDERTFTPQSLAQLAHIEIDEAKKILDYTLKSSSTHSAWLSFMYPRLYIARQLLRDDGVIFISIDDNECANLKILCDEIFGEENFLAQIIWKQFHSVKNDANNFSKNTEYILCYSKNTIKNIIHNEVFDKSDFYKLDDKDGKGFYKLDPVWAKSGTNAETYIFKNGKSWKPPSGTFWRYSIETLKQMENENEIVFNGKNPMAKRYLNRVSVGRKSSTFWDGKEVGYTLNGDAELKNIFDNNKIFDNPKPTNLIKRIMQISTNPLLSLRGEAEAIHESKIDCHDFDKSKSRNDKEPDIILDFFAGSGTTAHAVMELNAQDNGNRQFILVQLDEKIDSKKSKSKVAYDFCKNELGSENPSIFDITKERIKRASAKIAQSSLQSKAEIIHTDSSLRGFEKAEAIHESKIDCHESTLLQSVDSRNDSIISEIDLGFKVYELRENDLDSHNGSLIDLSDSDKNALLETFRLQDSLPLSVANKPVNLNKYSAILAGQNLYLLNSGFDSNALKDLIARIDSDKDFVIKEISYLNNAFDSAKIRELAEGIQSYANKKELKILVRGRFI